MALSGREKITIGAGAAIILVTVLVKLGALGLQSSGPVTADTIAGAIARIEQHKALKTSVAQLAEELSVELPTVDSTEQETKIRQSIAQLAQQNGLQVSTLRRMESGSSLRRTTTRPIQFQLSLKGPFDGLVQYINVLEQSSSPFVVRELSVNAARGPQGQPGGPPAPPQGGGRGGQDQPPTGQIQANMRLQAHLFPEVLKTDKPKAESTPPAMPSGGPQPPQGPMPMEGSSMPAMPAPPAMTPPATDSATPQASPPPAPTGKIGRKTITIPGGPTIVIEGNTVTVNGQVQQVSAEEIEKGLSQLPPGATVVEE